MSTPTPCVPRHFLTLLDLTPQEHSWVIQRAIELKQIRNSKTPYEPLRNRVLGMIFELRICLSSMAR
jgi:ornithine carbamoyltransferase